MKELAEFTAKVTEFLTNIRESANNIFVISREIQKEAKTFREDVFKVEEKIDRIIKLFEEMVNSVNQIHDIVKFLSERLSNFSIFVKGKYHEFLTVINYLRKIENLGSALIENFEEIFFVSRNAEIKAFHLGEKGSGLGVVARELAKLTEKVKQKAEEFQGPLSRLKKHYLSSEEFSSRFIEKIEFIAPTQKTFEDLFERVKESKNILESSSTALSEFLSRIKIAIKNFGNFIQEFISLTEETITIGEDASNLFSLVGGIHETMEFNEKILKALNSPEKRKFPRQKIHILLRDFENVIREVARHVERITENVKNWETLLKKSEEYFRPETEGEFEKEVRKIENVFGENLREKTSVMEKESYSLVNSIEEMFVYLKNLKEIETNTKDSVKLLEKSISALRSCVKDGDILSIYSLIETKRAGLEDDSIARELQLLVSKAEKNIKEIIELSQSLEKTGVLSYTAGDDESTEIQKKTGMLGREIPVFEKKITEAGMLIDLIKKFDITLRKWHEKILKFFDSIIQTQSTIKEEIEKINSEINVFFESMKKERDFELPEIMVTKEDVLRLILTSDPITLNPYLSEDSVSNTIISKIHKGLFTLSPLSTKILPCIAEGFEISRDGLRYRIKLRRDVYFHNERPLTSFEVYTSIKKALKGAYKNFFMMIEGGEDYIRGMSDEIKGVKIIDEGTVEINLEYPFAPFLSNLTLLNASITYDENGKLYGTGPYVLREWIRGKKIVLERFNKYFYGTPYFARVEYLINPEERNLENVIKGKIHYLELSPDEMKELKEKFPESVKNLEKVPAFSIQKLDFNHEKEPFNNPDVRKALCYAISPKEFVGEVLKGNALPAKGIFPPGYEFYNPEVEGYEKDLNKAREFLKRAALEEGFEFVLSYSPRGIYKEGGKFIKKALAELNVKVILQELEWRELLEKSKGEGLQSLMIGWGADTPDPDAFVFPLFHSSARSHTRFKDKEIDALIEKARRERNIEERKKIYSLIEKKVLEKAPCIFLFHPLINGLRNEKIVGIVPHPIRSAEIFYAVKND